LEDRARTGAVRGPAPLRGGRQRRAPAQPLPDLDRPARSVQNRAVLLVDDGGGGKYPGNAQAASTLRIAGLLADPNNNVLVVRIPSPRPGTYRVAVTASTLLEPPQDFALVVTGDLASNLRVI
jgi:hypothetical protein